MVACLRDNDVAIIANSVNAKIKLIWLLNKESFICNCPAPLTNFSYRFRAIYKDNLFDQKIGEFHRKAEDLRTRI